MGYNLRDDVVGQQPEVGTLQLFVGEGFVVVPVELLFYIVLLLFVGPVNEDGAEAELGQRLLEPQSAQLYAVGIDPAVYPALYRVHDADGAVVSYLLQFVQAVEVQEVHVVVLEGHHKALRFGKRVVRFLHDHVFYLAHQVVFLRFLGVACHDAAYDDVRVEVFSHDVGGEVVVDASVVGQRAVYLYGLEHEGETHRGTHGIAQVARTHDERFLVVDIRGYTTEGDEQLVEVAVAAGRCLGKQLHEDYVHLHGVHDVGGQQLGLLDF